ncbi:MAG TPA: hypothetical protein VF950_09635 [Planctomycetota bacterium]
MRIAVLLVLLFAQEKPLKIVMVAQDSPQHYDAQLLGELDRPAGDGVTIGAERRETKVDDKGRLEIDVKGDGKFRALSGKREIVTFALQGDGDKPKTVNAKFEFRKNEKGDWVVRNLTQLTVQIGAEQFVVVDANANGVYNEPRVDGLAWMGQTWLFPLPSTAERWCSATMEFTGLEFGPIGDGPKVTGRPLATTVPEALPVLKGVNEERVKLGLTPRPEDVKLSADLQKHCKYMVGTGVLAHPEEKGKPGYSEEGHAAGMRSILGRGMGADTLAFGMVNTYFHRQDVIRPQALAFGVGYEGAFGGIDGRSAMGKAPAQYWPVLCPVPGQQNVGLNYGKEAPDACPGDAAAGYPITVYWGTSNLKIKSHSLKAVPPGPLPKGLPEVECYVYDPAQGVEAGMTRYQQCVCLIAKDPLKPNTTYEVALAVDVDGKPWSKTWRFTTGAGGGGFR